LILEKDDRISRETTVLNSGFIAMASPQLRGQLQRGWRLSLQKEPRREDRDNGYKLHWVKFHFGMRKKFCGFFFVLRTISGTTSSGR